MSHGLRVAAVQAARSRVTSRAMSRRRLSWVEKAAAQGARLVVLPELFIPGYDPETLASKADEVDVTSRIVG